MVTDLHDSVTTRSEKFIVWQWLAPLCKDYATDIVKDSSHALMNLNELEVARRVRDHMPGMDPA